MGNILTIDIGGSSIKYGTFTKSGELIAKSSFDVPSTFEGLKEEIKKLFLDGEYIAISISSPGAIDTKTGNGYGITAIDYLPKGGNLKQQLSEELNVPVAIENDANCAGLSEVHFSEGLDSIAYIVLGSGVGGCMIVDGKVVTGSTFFGGEFGYIPFKNDTYSRHSGMRGLSKNATGSAEPVMSGIEIFKRYEQGEKAFVDAVNLYYEGIASLITILKYTQNPQQIIFAGAVTNRPTFLDEVRTAMKLISERPIDSNIDDVNISISQFGSDANLYGAYANLVRNYEI
ncbi:ROK family protein [Mollicutes bacterium LVI A0039]|nr:ROK family protein [Mollicutes bacterium LVI A0039]